MTTLLVMGTTLRGGHEGRGYDAIRTDPHIADVGIVLIGAVADASCLWVKGDDGAIGVSVVLWRGEESLIFGEAAELANVLGDLLVLLRDA